MADANEGKPASSCNGSATSESGGERADAPRGVVPEAVVGSKTVAAASGKKLKLLRLRDGTLVLHDGVAPVASYKSQAPPRLPGVRHPPFGAPPPGMRPPVDSPPQQMNEKEYEECLRMELLKRRSEHRTNGSESREPSESGEHGSGKDGAKAPDSERPERPRIPAFRRQLDQINKVLLAANPGMGRPPPLPTLSNPPLSIPTSSPSPVNSTIEGSETSSQIPCQYKGMAWDRPHNLKRQKAIDRVQTLSLEDLVIDWDDPLGRGAYGEVYRCWSKTEDERAKQEGRVFPRSGDLMAIKIIKIDDGGCQETLMKNATAVKAELRSWDALWKAILDVRKKQKNGWKYLVKPLKPFECQGRFHMLMDFMHFGSLDDLMLTLGCYEQRQLQDVIAGCMEESILDQEPPMPSRCPNPVGVPLPEPVLSYVLCHVLNGLSFIHTLRKPMAHLDIKPGNILINTWGQVKIGDFGLMKFVEETDGYGGTRMYMSPERVLSKEATPAADIWGLGVSALECALGLNSESKVHLFSEAARTSWVNSVDFAEAEGGDIEAEKKLRLRLSWEAVEGIVMKNEQLCRAWHALSDDFKDFCKNCMEFNYRERPTAEKLLHHKFIVDHRSTWQNQQMRLFLDVLVQNQRKFDPYGKTKWEKRVWSDLKSRKRSTVRNGPPYGSRQTTSASRGRGGQRRSWRGDWRGRRKGRGGGSMGASGNGTSGAEDHAVCEMPPSAITGGERERLRGARRGGRGVAGRLTPPAGSEDETGKQPSPGQRSGNSAGPSGNGGTAKDFRRRGPQSSRKGGGRGGSKGGGWSRPRSTSHHSPQQVQQGRGKGRRAFSVESSARGDSVVSPLQERRDSPERLTRCNTYSSERGNGW